MLRIATTAAAARTGRDNRGNGLRPELLAGAAGAIAVAAAALLAGGQVGCAAAEAEAVIAAIASGVPIRAIRAAIRAAAASAADLIGRHAPAIAAIAVRPPGCAAAAATGAVAVMGTAIATIAAGSLERADATCRLASSAAAGAAVAP